MIISQYPAHCSRDRGRVIYGVGVAVDVAVDVLVAVAVKVTVAEGGMGESVGVDVTVGG